MDDDPVCGMKDSAIPENWEAISTVEKLEHGVTYKLSIYYDFAEL